jgi:putative N6-adenine-specific DNA methylase
MKTFRSEGGVVKTEAEKRLMAEKHRFKKHREFKQRLDEQEENEDSDIRSFTFHRHDLEPQEPRRPRKPRESGESGYSGYSGYSGHSGHSGHSGKPGKPGSPKNFSENRGGHERFDRSGKDRKSNKRYDPKHED